MDTSLVGWPRVVQEVTAKSSTAIPLSWTEGSVSMWKMTSMAWPAKLETSTWFKPQPALWLIVTDGLPTPRVIVAPIQLNTRRADAGLPTCCTSTQYESKLALSMWNLCHQLRVRRPEDAGRAMLG